MEKNEGATGNGTAALFCEEVFKRAGADAILTYFAPAAATWLDGD